MKPASWATCAGVCSRGVPAGSSRSSRTSPRLRCGRKLRSRCRAQKPAPTRPSSVSASRRHRDAAACGPAADDRGRGSARAPRRRAGRDPAGPARASSQDAGREHRLQQQGRADRHQQGEGHGQGLVAEERPGDAGHVDHREEDRDRRQAGRHDRPRHLAGALVGGKCHLSTPPGRPQRRVGIVLLLWSSPHQRQMAVDVLEHHDRVVDQHAGRQRQPAEAHQVQLDVAEVEQPEGDDDGDRDGETDHPGAAPVAEKDEQHQDGQHSAEHQGLHQPLERRPDVRRIAVDEVVAKVRVVGRDHRQRLVQRLRDQQGVGLRLLVDEHGDDRAAAEQGRPLGLLDRVDDPGDVGDPHRRPAGQTDVGRGDVVQALELAIDSQTQMQWPLTDLAAGEGDVAAHERPTDVLHVDAVDRHLAGIGLDQDLAVGAAHDLGSADAVHLLEGRLHHLTGELRQRLEAPVSLQHQDADRSRARIPAQNDRPVRGLRKIVPEGDPVDRLSQMEIGEVHLRSPLVLHRDDGDALAGPGQDVANPGLGGDRLLESLGDEALEILGRDVLVDGEDREARIDDRRQQIHRQPRVAQAADQQQRREQHADRDRALEGGTEHSA